MTDHEKRLLEEFAQKYSPERIRRAIRIYQNEINTACTNEIDVEQDKISVRI